MDWTIADAQRSFCEVVKALHEGPQRVIWNTEAVFVISETEYRTLKSHGPERNDFLRFLMSGSGSDEIDLSRDKSLPREIDW